MLIHTLDFPNFSCPIKDILLNNGLDVPSSVKFEFIYQTVNMSSNITHIMPLPEKAPMGLELMRHQTNRNLLTCNVAMSLKECKRHVKRWSINEDVRIAVCLASRTMPIVKPSVYCMDDILVISTPIPDELGMQFKVGIEFHDRRLEVTTYNSRKESEGVQFNVGYARCDHTRQSASLTFKEPIRHEVKPIFFCGNFNPKARNINVPQLGTIKIASRQNFQWDFVTSTPAITIPEVPDIIQVPDDTDTDTHESIMVKRMPEPPTEIEIDDQSDTHNSPLCAQDVTSPPTSHSREEQPAISLDNTPNIDNSQKLYSASFTHDPTTEVEGYESGTSHGTRDTCRHQSSTSRSGRAARTLGTRPREKSRPTSPRGGRSSQKARSRSPRRPRTPLAQTSRRTPRSRSPWSRRRRPRSKSPRSRSPRRFNRYWRSGRTRHNRPRSPTPPRPRRTNPELRSITKSSEATRSSRSRSKRTPTQTVTSKPNDATYTAITAMEVDQVKVTVARQAEGTSQVPDTDITVPDTTHRTPTKAEGENSEINPLSERGGPQGSGKDERVKKPGAAAAHPGPVSPRTAKVNLSASNVSDFNARHADIVAKDGSQIRQKPNAATPATSAKNKKDLSKLYTELFGDDHDVSDASSPSPDRRRRTSKGTNDTINTIGKPNFEPGSTRNQPTATSSSTSRSRATSTTCSTPTTTTTGARSTSTSGPTESRTSAKSPTSTVTSATPFAASGAPINPRSDGHTHQTEATPKPVGIIGDPNTISSSVLRGIWSPKKDNQSSTDPGPNPSGYYTKKYSQQRSDDTAIIYDVHASTSTSYQDARDACQYPAFTPTSTSSTNNPDNSGYRARFANHIRGSTSCSERLHPRGNPEQGSGYPGDPTSPYQASSVQETERSRPDYVRNPTHGSSAGRPQCTLLEPSSLEATLAALWPGGHPLAARGNDSGQPRDADQSRRIDSRTGPPTDDPTERCSDRSAEHRHPIHEGSHHETLHTPEPAWIDDPLDAEGPGDFRHILERP